MPEVDENANNICAKLDALPERAAVTLVTDVNGYFSALKGVLQHAHNSKLGCIYIAATIPPNVVTDQMSQSGFELQSLYFVDCISFLVGAPRDAINNTLYIESPTMLENIMLKVQAWLKRMKEERKMVFLDSVNTLSVHNEQKILSEFLHYLINSMRTKDICTVILSVEGQTPEDLENILKLVCDDTIDAKGGEVPAEGSEGGGGGSADGSS